MLLGCCDYADNGPSNVNAASKHDGPPDTTDEPSLIGHNRNGELKSLFCSVFLDFFDKMKFSLFTGMVSKTGSVPLTKIPFRLQCEQAAFCLHSPFWDTFTHIDNAEGCIVLHLNLSYFLLLRQNAPSIMSVFGRVSLCMYLQI